MKLPSLILALALAGSSAKLEVNSKVRGVKEHDEHTSSKYLRGGDHRPAGRHTSFASHSEPPPLLGGSGGVVQTCCPNDDCPAEFKNWIPKNDLNCPYASKLLPDEIAERANAEDGGARAYYKSMPGGRNLFELPPDGNGYFKYNPVKGVFQYARLGGIPGKAPSDEVEYDFEYGGAGVNSDGVKLWKKSCPGGSCPGYYRVYMGCENFNGPHCYLHFYCTKSNSSPWEAFDEC